MNFPTVAPIIVAVFWGKPKQGSVLSWDMLVQKKCKDFACAKKGQEIENTNPEYFMFLVKLVLTSKCCLCVNREQRRSHNYNQNCVKLLSAKFSILRENDFAFPMNI